LLKLKLCKPYIKKYNVASPSSITITIPGSEAADADRRRQKALKALNDRMKNKDTTSEAWPEIDDTQQISPLLTQNPMISTATTTIDMSGIHAVTNTTSNIVTKDDLNQNQETTSS